MGQITTKITEIKSGIVSLQKIIYKKKKNTFAKVNGNTVM